MRFEPRGVQQAAIEAAARILAYDDWLGYISFRIVADGFDVVATRIKDEGPVVIGMVMQAQARCAIIPSACPQRRLVERIHLSAGYCRKGDMDASRDLAAVTDPEERSPAGTKARMRHTASLLGCNIHKQFDAERTQRLLIELL
jgi:hypothetical protein